MTNKTIQKIFFIITLFLIIIPFGQTNAFEMRAEEELNIVEEVKDDLYVAGGRVDITAPIDGDLIISGGDLNIDSYISEDLIAAGGDITIKGEIGDDVRVVGGNVEISSNINGDLIIGAGDVRINENVVIGGDLVIGAGRVVMNGEVMGDSKISAGQLELNGVINGDGDFYLDDFKSSTGTGLIKGNLEYKSDKKLNKLEGVTKGEVTFEKTMMNSEVKKSFIGFLTSYLIIKIIGLFIFASLIYLYYDKLFSSISNNLRKKTGKSFLYGFVTIVGTPILIILLLISVIGIPVALLLLFAYIFLMLFLGLINIMVFSSFFINKYKIKELYKKLLIIFGLTLLFGLTNGLSLIAGFFTLGAVGIKKIEILKSLRK